MFKPDDKLLLIDASGFIHRAYHAVGPKTRKSDGLPVGAVDGFVSLLWGVLVSRLGDWRPSHAACIFDYSGRTFRTEIFDGYKANRSAPDEDLRPQFALCRAASAAFGIPAIEEPGFEADDLIATYAGMAEDSGAETVVVTSDKDMMQIVTERTRLLLPPKGKDRDGNSLPWTFAGIQEVIDKFGVMPDQVPQVLAIAGDHTDNVPGVKGIGEKGASALIAQYRHIENIIMNYGLGKKEARVAEQAEDARMSLRLVTLDREAPIYHLPDDLICPAPLPADRIIAFLKAMELWSQARKIGGESGVNPDEIDPDPEFKARRAA